MKKLLLLLASLILLGVLVVVYLPVTPNEPAPAKVGADRDAHGCIASAGYTYSVVRNACIRVWEEGIALSPVGAEVDGPTLAAYAVLGNDGSVEVFLPGQEKGIVFSLTLKKSGEQTVWENTADGLVLTYAGQEKGWALSQAGQVLYASQAQ